MIEADIKETAPMKHRKFNRNGLRAFLGKTINYTGTFSKVGVEGRTVLTNIRKAGSTKILCDHLWVDGHTQFRKGIDVSFKGVATSYKKSNGDRKYKISLTRNLQELQWTTEKYWKR